MIVNITLRNMDRAKLANMFDHTLLKPDAQEQDFRKLCEESIQYGFKMVAVNSVATAMCKKMLEGSNVHVGAAISFPLGQTTIESKLFETENAIQNGADEIDYVINISKLKNLDLLYIAKEMSVIVNTCKKNNVISKVIFENCYLAVNEIKTLCEIALEFEPDFIKTSTGFGVYGARMEDVTVMKSMVGDHIKVKASGGIRDLSSVAEMIKAGAERIGTSSGVKIIEEYKQMGFDASNE
jgi:deoxyribose-phosphate aldolase